MAAATPPLRDYQVKGICWIVDRLGQYKAVLVGDEMGLGKCLEALCAATRLNAERVLIVCPAGARRVWQAEIKRWLPGWLNRVVLVEPGSRPVTLPKTPLILIVGYDELSDLKSLLAVQLGRRRWDLLILDEAHYLKNPSNRTLALYGRRGSGEGIQASAARVILLTGTPAPNHSGELWQHVRTFWPSLVPGGAGTQAGFEDRFCKFRDTVFGRQITGSKNQKILREALAPVVLRRRKDEVLTELPPLVVQDIPLTAGGDRERRNTRAGLARSYAGYDTGNVGFKQEKGANAKREKISATSFDVAHAGRLSARAEGSSRGISAADQRLSGLAAALTDDEFLKILRNPDTAVATARRELGLLKVGPTILWVQERMASVNKLLLFAWHIEVIEQLRRGLLEFAPVVVTGQTSPNARASGVENFQRNPATRIFVGQILAAGTAITLTAANEVAIVEPSWVPGENVQAIARAHRLGQRDMVLASFLYLPGTLDQRIMQVFRRKAAEISELQGDDNANGNETHRRSGDRRRAGRVSAVV